VEEIKDACGVVGIKSKEKSISERLFLGLYALQHRGQESAGISVSDGNELRTHKAMGLVNSVFSESILAGLEGSLGIGHTRYSTTGASIIENAQPSIVNSPIGEIAVAHNGNLVNYKELKNQLIKWSAIPSDIVCSDTSLIAHTISFFLKSTHDLEKAVERTFKYIKGSFSLVILSKDQLIALRDKNGLRPLCIGSFGDKNYMVASESCALNASGATFEREIQAAEMVTFGKNGFKSKLLDTPDPKLCVFEFIYTARPDSILYGQSVYQVRKRFGLQLAKEFHPQADLVMAVPDTAIPSAIGYAQGRNLPFEEGLIKNRYSHRTFIEPDSFIRKNRVRMKLSALPHVVANKKVILIDDSLVRGTTTNQVVRMVKEAGAREVHLLISSPPIKFPDYYGIDIADKADLIAAQKTTEEIRQYIGADSLHYLSLNGMYTAVGVQPSKLCTSCFTGIYPVIPEQINDSKQNHIMSTKEEQLILETTKV
jgi:amidophosphoribosyltransferase